MKRILSAGLLVIMGTCPVVAQQPDTIPLSLNIREIIVTAKTGFNPGRQAKSSASVEEYLQSSGKAGMIKRGNYAWEPSVNGMTSERISVTIDGMKIFHACTDRMDPVTSYVETVNLGKVSLGSGFEANPNASNHIGGSIDMRLNKSGFCTDGFSANVSAGYESNGNLQVYGADMSYANPHFYINSGIFHRSSSNYRAGKSKEVLFSQFNKNNFFSNIGYVVANGKAIEGTLIYDHARNVGYPALTMDVATADGLISSLAYTMENPFPKFYKWETKVYYNNIVHIMDDTKRPDVIMHMDMPGNSRTGGAYSTLSGRNDNHRYSLNIDGYYNRSYAEMTMYSNNRNEMPMFMLTWGDVRTINAGIFAIDEYRINDNHSARLSSKISFQRDGVGNEEIGYESLLVYYPEMPRYKGRIIGNVAARYLFNKNGWEASASAGYGSRAPSVSEAYGFFLFNTFDSYDYLGNPGLKNESSLETSLILSKKYKTLEVKTEASCFYFYDYIIGKPNVELHHMTIGATGVKVYQNLPRATIMNLNLSFKYRFANNFIWQSNVLYARGKDDKNNSLPLISPISYNTSLTFLNNHFTAEAGINGAARQTNFNPEYGEDETGEYFIANLSAGYDFKAGNVIFRMKTGVENLFDKYYSTYSDWKNIPRKGRNIFLNLGINFN
ncbi:MAG: hypothetical protein LBH04_03740 [Tannerellaceae bacterium]|jgi:iron complex outermembrane receptor protein|nr:hypothetical protein [Tannerellaceae bacterium]